MMKCYYYTFNFSCETIFIIIIIFIISVFPIIIMLCFQRHKQYSFLCIVIFIAFKEIFQNIQELVQRGTYETGCHGTSVNGICYMAQ